jgi:adenylate cyclase
MEHDRVLPSTADSRSLALVVLVLVMLAGLPLAVWLDLRNLTETSLLRQARDLNSVVSSVRAYYASNVVGRVLASPGSTQVAHNYETIPGAIPIPATLSLELGRVISEQQQNIAYRFVSDSPFKNRAPIRLTVSRPAQSQTCAIPITN